MNTPIKSEEDFDQEAYDKACREEDLKIRATRIYEKRLEDKRNSEIRSIMERLRSKEDIERLRGEEVIE